MKPTTRLSWRQPIDRLATAILALTALSLVPAWAQTPSTQSGKAADQNANDITNPDQAQTPIQLTPFEVSASQEHGYFSPTTLAGTRLNNNIADLPSSISIVTRQE